MDDKIIFAMYYAGLVAMQYHPRNKTTRGPEEGFYVDLESLAKVASEMLLITNLLFDEEDNGHGFEHDLTLG